MEGTLNTQNFKILSTPISLKHEIAERTPKKKSGLPHSKKFDSHDPENWTGSVQVLDCDSPTNNNNTKKSKKKINLRINFGIVVVGWTITV
jgi:hypothetical protein